MSEEIFYDKNDYSSPNNNSSGSDENPNAYKKGLAIASFVLSLVNMFCCFCWATPILGVLALIFAIVSLATKCGGKVFAIIGLVLSSIATLICIVMFVNYGGIISDVYKFSINADHYVSEYDRTGEIPEEFQKYNGPEYAEAFRQTEYGSFENFYKTMIENVRGAAASSDTTSSSSNSSGSSGETPVDLSYTGANAGIMLRAI